MFQEITLDNNVHILTEEVPYVRSVAVGFWVDVGSRDESRENNGISHFIEHILFKGTVGRTARQIAETLDAVGGQLNAFTTKEYTCYYARVLDEHFDLAMDLLCDMLFNSRFDPEDINRERNVIIEEIKMYEDTPDELVHDIFAGTLWQDHSLGAPIIGNAGIVAKISGEEILKFYNQNYKPGKMVVSVAGNITHEKVVAKLKPVLESRNGLVEKRVMVGPKPHQQVTCREKDTEQVHLCIGTPGVSLKDEKIHAFQVANTILGGGMSSRLFQTIREQKGLVYSVYSYHSSYHDSGLFCVYAGLSKENISEVLDLIFKEIKDIQKNGVNALELQRAKDQLRGNLLLSLESVSTRMSRLGKSKLYLDRVIPTDEVVDRINQVTAEKVQELMRDMLGLDKFNLAAIGPWEDEKEVRRINEKMRSVKG